MLSTSLLRSLAALAFALGIAGSALAQDAEAPDAAPEAPAAPKPKAQPRKPAPAKPTPAKPTSDKAAPAPVAAPANQWPIGASSLSEVYGDWTVTCAKAGDASAPESKPECAVMQSQGAKGRREFAIELRTPAEGRAQGYILMPLGLAIEPGLSFKLDEAVLGKGAPFLSCGQEGCLVPIGLPTLATDTMKTAKNLLVSAMKPDAKDPTVITVPLTGFGDAMGRAIALTK